MSSHDASGSGNGDKGSKKSPATYSLKIINPNNAGGELIINDLEVPKRPTSADEFKVKVCEHFLQYTMYVAYATIYRQVRIIDLGQSIYRPPQNSKCACSIMLSGVCPVLTRLDNNLLCGCAAQRRHPAT